MLFRTMLVPANRAKLVTYAGVNPRNYITVHQTGNTKRGANADMHARLQYNGNSRAASWHEQVDDKECVQSFDHTAKCWHGSDGRAGAGNNKSIAIEICVNSDGDYTRAVRNGARRVAQLMKMYNIPISRVVQHNHWSGKACPAQIGAGKNGINWSAFLKIVQEELDGPGDGATPAPAPAPTPAPAPSYEWPGAALRVDGDRGAITVRAWQRLLAGIGHYSGRIDGQWGPLSIRAEQSWLKSLGFYTGDIDGDEGRMTIRALQRFLAAKGLYRGRIDGVRGSMTVKAEQTYLNDQRQYFVNKEV